MNQQQSSQNQQFGNRFGAPQHLQPRQQQQQKQPQRIKKEENAIQKLWNKFKKPKLGAPEKYESPYISQNHQLAGFSVSTRNILSIGSNHNTHVQHMLNLGIPMKTQPGMPPEMAHRHSYSFTLLHSVKEGAIQFDSLINPLQPEMQGFEQPMMNHVCVFAWSPSAMPSWFTKLTGTRFPSMVSPDQKPLNVTAIYNGVGDEFSLEAKYRGKDYNFGADINSNKIGNVRYQQRISRSLSAGVRAHYMHANRISNVIWNAVYQPSPQTRNSKIGVQYKQKYRDGIDEEVYNVSYSDAVTEATRMRVEYNLSTNGKSRMVYSLKHDFLPMDGANMLVSYDSDHTMQTAVHMPLQTGDLAFYTKWEDKPANALSYGVQFTISPE
mmetsp:Transcript_6889/g.10082  ORF Transcript_6889/g.10082 Transcript_6889/m.10082 type:complete len:381 (+) Transcript_6889:46-1188(+)